MLSSILLLHRIFIFPCKYSQQRSIRASLHIFYVESPRIDSYADIDLKNCYQHYRFTRALPSNFNQHFNDTSFASYCIKCANTGFIELLMINGNAFDNR